MGRVTAAVIERDGRILIARRKTGDRFGPSSTVVEIK